MSNIKATIVTIGDELLIGQTIDTNSAWMAQRLNELGVSVLRRVAVGDEADAITTALDDERKLATVILITGGLGPTSDDITKPLLCKYFGGKLVVNDVVLEHIRAIFTKFNRPIIDRNLKQAEVPDNCTVLFNRMGTAPGMWFEDGGTIFVSMPGVPFEMRAIMEDEVLPRLKTMLKTDAFIHRTTVTAGEGESFIAEKLMDFEAALPQHLHLAYLPDAGFVKLRLTGSGTDATILEHQLAAWQQKLMAILGDIVIATEDIAVEQILSDALRHSGKWISTAESCTGGFIGHQITQVPGASVYFKGSVVAYDNSVKEGLLGVSSKTLETFGAVSEETVTAMAKGALRVFGTDYSLATSGVLGPDGGTPNTPVGTVWMAAATRDRVVTKMYKFRYDRLKNKEMAAKNGMLLLWKLITGRV